MQSEFNRAFAETLKRQRVVPVLTIPDADTGVALARALVDGGLPLIEVTLRTAGAIQIIKRVASVPGVMVGAGTILSPEQADAAIAAGAKFIVSPGATAHLIEAAQRWPVPYLPGVATAGEAMGLATRGYRVLKLFPSEPAGGVGLLKALAAPLPDILFCPTGGIDAGKAPAYLALKNVVAVGGSWVAPEKLIAGGDWTGITTLAREANAIGKPEGSPATAPAVETPASPAASPAGAEARPADDEEETLTQRLRKLNEAIEPFAGDAAHAGEIAEQKEFRIAQGLLAKPDTPLATVIDYACGAKWTLSCVALAALAERQEAPTVAGQIAERFEEFSTWQMRFALPVVLKSPEPMVDAMLAGFRDWWADNVNVAQVFTDYFEALGDKVPESLGPSTRKLAAGTQERLKGFLARVKHPRAETLARELKTPPPTDPSSAGQRSVLDTVGRFWGDRDQTNLIEPADWQDALAAADAVLNRTPPRSLLVSGDALVGKTSFLRLLARRLKAKRWRIYEASGSDLQAGQLYIGQLEGRLRQLIGELAVGNRVIWYVPDLLQLALSGTHQGQSSSMLDQLLPAMTEGRLLIMTEATPASVARLLQLRSNLRRVLEVVRLESFDTEQTIEMAKPLAESLATAARLKVEAGFAEAAVEAAAHYLGSGSLPGSALSLVRLTAVRAETGDKKLKPHDALETLAQLTGLPISILDGSERLDLAKIRSFFSSRVIGQPEAVESIVERIAMLKAGLNDPMKPIGVFLFAGPTGTGKTELAKALAEYLFGSVDRMIRLDMSEYQTPDSLGKIVGGPALSADADTLISRIRKQPFSVLLLDEFEKSNPQIWDLFLQVFDEGRLTDAQGQVADFRHSIIILTTNLGATRHRTSGLGFAPARAAFTGDQVLNAVSETFRPEFQNRLDKVIVFQPLTRDLMRGILKKELDRLFERRGLRDRDWAIEWEASALEFLLEKGFSPEMGARPLKRAIDQYVAAPLAQTIVERRFPAGDQFVFVRSDGLAIQAEFVDPDGDGETYDPKKAAAAAADAGLPATLGAMILGAKGSAGEIAMLDATAEEIAARVASAEWDEKKSALVAEMNKPEFWSRPDRFQALAGYALMDRIELASETARSLQSRLGRRSGAESGARELISRLAMQLHLIRDGLIDLDEGAPIEVAVAVEPAFDSGGERKAGSDWSDRVLGMYRAWARRRSMQTSELDGVKGRRSPVLLISGFGAGRRLLRETGLHVLETADATAPRIAARVMVATAPLGDMPRTRIAAAVAEQMAGQAASGNVVRRYREGASPRVRNAEGTWRTGKVGQVLAGDFDLLQGD